MKKLKKSSYLLVLFILASECFGLLPFAEWMTLMNNVAGQAALALWMVYGLRTYRKADHGLYRKEYNKPTWFILGAVFFSMIPAYLYYGQSILTSVVAYRAQYFWLFIPVLLYIRPNAQELIKTLNTFACLYAIALIIRNYVASSLFYISEKVLENWAYYEDEVMLIPGYVLLLIPYYYYCDKIKNSGATTRNIMMVMFFFIVFFISENRSTLFVAALVLGYVILKKKSHYKFLFLLCASTVVVIMAYFTADVWLSLFRETTEQLDDEDYNRVKAFAYFVFQANENWVTAIFGNGFLSAHTSSKMQDLMELGIYNSDLGMIGYWNQYGIIPVVTFLVYIWRSFRAKWCPFYVKAIGFHLLACALTISYFGTPANILWFVVFYYLYVYYQHEYVISKNR